MVEDGGEMAEPVPSWPAVPRRRRGAGGHREGLRNSIVSIVRGLVADIAAILMTSIIQEMMSFLRAIGKYHLSQTLE